MTERFTLDKYWNIDDNYEQKSYDGGEDCGELCELLNVLNDNNNQLKEENEVLKKHMNDTEIAVEIETEKCMQRVFGCIDEKIKFVEICEENFVSNLDYYRGASDILKVLKKDLKK